MIKQEVDAIRESGYVDERVPIAVLEMFKKSETKNVSTFTDSYHDVYAGIVAGAKGIMVYSYAHRREVPGTYDGYKKAAGEINGEEKLGEAILFGSNFGGIKLEVLSGPAIIPKFFDRKNEEFQIPSVNFIAKEYDEKIWLIAVNSSTEKISVEFRGFPKQTGILEEPFEKREISFEDNGNFKQDFEPLAVHIYRQSCKN